MATYSKYSTKTHGTRWEAWTSLDNVTARTNKRIHKKGFLTKKEAQLWVNKQQFEFRNQGFTTTNTIRFKELYEKWIEDDYKHQVRGSTLAKTEDIFRLHILPSLGSKRIADISVEECTRIVQKWCNSFKQYCRFRTYAITVFKFGIRMELTNRNPMEKTSIPKKKVFKKNNELESCYEKDELKLFLKSAKSYGNPQAFTFFRVLAFTGMRKGEVLALQWQDIDFKKNTIAINRTLAKVKNGNLDTQPPKTNSSVRTIPIDAKTIKYLRFWKITQEKHLLLVQKSVVDGDQLVFANRNNQLFQPSVPDHWNRSICKKYHLRRIKIHGFRHTFCTLAIEAGDSIPDVSKKLGHADLKITQEVYLHITKKQGDIETNKVALYMDN